MTSARTMGIILAQHEGLPNNQSYSQQPCFESSSYGLPWSWADLSIQSPAARYHQADPNWWISWCWQHSPCSVPGNIFWNHDHGNMMKYGLVGPWRKMVCCIQKSKTTIFVSVCVCMCVCVLCDFITFSITRHSTYLQRSLKFATWKAQTIWCATPRIHPILVSLPWVCARGIAHTWAKTHVSKGNTEPHALRSFKEVFVQFETDCSPPMSLGHKPPHPTFLCVASFWLEKSQPNQMFFFLP